MKWPKEQKVNAERRGEALFAFAMNDRLMAKPKFGAVEFVGPMNQDLAIALAQFIIKLRTGKTPQEAFGEAHWPAPASKDGVSC